MSSSFWVKLYLLTVPLFFVVDMIWLGLIARGFYQQQLQRFLAPQVNWSAAMLFYLLYIGGILFFAVNPALTSGTVVRAATLGALFGFFTYATYDLTNLATLDRWPVKVVVVDIAWGSALCAVVATGAFLIGKRLS
jgi:uncharacterized membrane protein